jgi:hypothetical protein
VFGSFAALALVAIMATNVWAMVGVIQGFSQPYQVFTVLAHFFLSIIALLVLLGVVESNSVVGIFPHLESFYGIGLSCIYIAVQSLAPVGARGTQFGFKKQTLYSDALLICAYILAVVGLFYILLACLGGKTRVEKSKRAVIAERNP